MSAEHPRVLIVTSDDIAASTGTGITLRNLFGDWPRDRLAQIHLVPSSGEHEIARVRYPPTAVPLDDLVRRAARGRRISIADGAPRIAAVPLAEGAPRSARRHAALRAVLDLSPVLPSSTVHSFVDRFSPDLVYSLLGSVRVMRLTSRLASRSLVPLVPHFMDDWPRTLYSSGELRGLARARADLHLASALAQAPLALCISEQMCTEYEARYDVECHPFVNPVEVPERAMDRPPPGIVELLYVGGLHLGRWASLLLVAEALTRLSTRARLSVYAPPADLVGLTVPRELAGHLVLGGSLEPDAVQNRLRYADVLVHVESFDEATSQYVQLSLSTKIPQYLASGRPILAVGPERVASLQVLAESRGGVVVGSRDLSQVEAGARRLVESAEARSNFGTAGHAYASAHFSQQSVRDRLRRVLASAGGI